MIRCENCDTTIDKAQINTRSFSPCSQCGTFIRTDIFNAALRVHEKGDEPETIVLSDDAGCFYHPSKKAVMPCASCGRFLCALCDIDMDGSHICFSCMEKGHEEKNKQHLETHRFLPDGLALRLSLLPPLSLVFSFFTCVTAPLSIYFVIKYWKSQTSITPRGKKWRFVLAFLFSSAQIAAWAGIIIMSVSG